MEKRGIALIIIALCLISIIIGIVNASGGKFGNTQEKAIFHGDKIAYIALEGPITSEVSSDLFGNLYTGGNAKKALNNAIEDDSVKGVLFEINSPGGTVAMSQEIYDTVIKLRKYKPVVFLMDDVAASGGYYIASAGDRIIAHSGTLTGSIGVIFSTFDAKELLNNKLGVKVNVIKSGKFKDIGSSYRSMTSDERTLLQNIINSTYQQFLAAIVKGRIKRNDNYHAEKTVLTVNTLKTYADGRIFTGEQAKKLGFVDALGGSDEAYKTINAMAKQKFNLYQKKLPLVSYNKPMGWSQYLFGATESFFPEKLAAKNVLPFSSIHHHKLLYVWE